MPYRILNTNHKKELLWSRWVWPLDPPTRTEGFSGLVPGRLAAFSGTLFKWSRDLEQHQGGLQTSSDCRLAKRLYTQMFRLQISKHANWNSKTLSQFRNSTLLQTRFLTTPDCFCALVSVVSALSRQPCKASRCLFLAPLEVKGVSTLSVSPEKVAEPQPPGPGTLVRKV